MKGIHVSLDRLLDQYSYCLVQMVDLCSLIYHAFLMVVSVITSTFSARHSPGALTKNCVSIKCYPVALAQELLRHQGIQVKSEEPMGQKSAFEDFLLSKWETLCFEYVQREVASQCILPTFPVIFACFHVRCCLEYLHMFLDNHGGLFSVYTCKCH